MTFIQRFETDLMQSNAGLKKTISSERIQRPTIRNTISFSLVVQPTTITILLPLSKYYYLKNLPSNTNIDDIDVVGGVEGMVNRIGI